MEDPILNSHNKAEYEPAHTAEHILNCSLPYRGEVHTNRERYTAACSYLPCRLTE